MSERQPLGRNWLAEIVPGAIPSDDIEDSMDLLDEHVQIAGKDYIVHGYKVAGKTMSQILDDFELTLEKAHGAVHMLTFEFVERWIARLRAVDRN